MGLGISSLSRNSILCMHRQLQPATPTPSRSEQVFVAWSVAVGSVHTVEYRAHQRCLARAEGAHKKRRENVYSISCIRASHWAMQAL